LILSLAVPGVGEISMAIAAGLAAERLISRALNNTLRLDTAAVSDTLAILGAVAQGAQLIGKLRIANSGKAFVGALRSADQAAVETAAAELEAARATGTVLNLTSTVVNAGGLIWGDFVMIKGSSNIQTAEMDGSMTHSEAARARADLMANAILTHGLMLHGMLKPEGADAVSGKAAGTEAPRKTPEAPRSTPERVPETMPEAVLERRANEPATAASDGQPSPSKDNVRAQFRTPDNLHDIFILEDGRIFRCSMVCSQLRDWYDPYLKRQPEGSRQQEAAELAGRLETLEGRAKAGARSAELKGIWRGDRTGMMSKRIPLRRIGR
jgi:hypothetical protein